MVEKRKRNPRKRRSPFEGDLTPPRNLTPPPRMDRPRPRRDPMPMGNTMPLGRPAGRVHFLPDLRESQPTEPRAPQPTNSSFPVPIKREYVERQSTANVNTQRPPSNTLPDYIIYNSLSPRIHSPGSLSTSRPSTPLVRVSRLQSPSPINSDQENRDFKVSRSELYGGPRSHAIPSPWPENDQASCEFENIPKLEPKCCDNFSVRHRLRKLQAELPNARSMTPDNSSSKSSKRQRRNLSSLEMSHTTLQLRHVTDSTFSADVLIKTLEGDSKNEVYIPVHKKVLTDNLSYFKMLFDETSNWQNLKIDEESNCKILNGEFATAEILIKYFKSIYDQKNLEPSYKDAFELFELADYFQDTEEINNLIDFIPQIISIDNFTKLMDEPFAKHFQDALIQFLTDASYLHECIEFRMDIKELSLKNLIDEGLDSWNSKTAFKIDRRLFFDNFFSKTNQMKPNKLSKLLELIPMLKDKPEALWHGQAEPTTDVYSSLKFKILISYLSLSNTSDLNAMRKESELEFDSEIAKMICSVEVGNISETDKIRLRFVFCSIQ